MIRFACGLILLIASPPLAAQPAAAPDTQPPAGAPAIEPAPVVVRGDTLFFYRARFGPYSAAERAGNLRLRLEGIARDPMRSSDPVRVVEGEVTSDLLVGDQVVASVTLADALAAGTSREALAGEWAAAIQSHLRQEGVTARLRAILVGVLFTLLALSATYLVFRLLGRLFARVVALVESGRGTWIPGLRLQRLELASSATVAAGLLTVVRAVRFVVIVLVLYISIPVILSFFPWTRGYADLLFSYVLTPFAMVWSGFLSYVPELFTVGAIAAVTWYLLKLIRPIFVGLRRETITIAGFYPEWAMPTYQIVRVLVILFAFIAIWPYLPGSGSPAFQGVGVFVGLLLSLGSATAIGNVIGGIVITYMRPFRLGDRVKIADTVGDVVEKTLLVTRVRTPKNVDITIPNAMVLGSHIVNYSSSATDAGLILHTKVTIGYDVPWRQVHELLLAAAARTEHVLAEPGPFVLQTALDDFYVEYELNAYTDQPRQMARIYSALHAAIQDAFREAGVEIMSPHYRAQRDGGASTVPAG